MCEREREEAFFAFVKGVCRFHASSSSFKERGLVPCVGGPWKKNDNEVPRV